MSSKAARPKKSTGNPQHQKAWRSMRILKQWTIPGVVCTIEGATVNSISKFVASLERHGIVEKIPGHQKGRVGDYQRYRIYQKLADQPAPPQVCHLCGERLSARICDPSQKQTETQTQTGKGGQQRSEALLARFAALPALTQSEFDQAEAELYPEKEKDRQTQRETRPAATEYPNEGFHVVPEPLKRRLMGGIHDAT